MIEIKYSGKVLGYLLAVLLYIIGFGYLSYSIWAIVTGSKPPIFIMTALIIMIPCISITMIYLIDKGKLKFTNTDKDNKTTKE